MLPSKHLLHHLLLHGRRRDVDAPALSCGAAGASYGELSEQVLHFGGALSRLGLRPGGRVAVYLEKRIETVVACFGASAAGGVFVPVNPIAKPGQLRHIVEDCGVSFLVTSGRRLDGLRGALEGCTSLRGVITVDPLPTSSAATPPPAVHDWSEMHAPGKAPGTGRLETDAAAILYTSGSTGRPRGVVLSHRNMVAGAESVASYLGNRRDDVLLAALPLSFDAGFSQLTTGFLTGAKVVLLNYLLPRDVLKVVAKERVTGITAVPPLWIQLARLDWPAGTGVHLRYIANTGGHMPADTLRRLRSLLPTTSVFLMYGLTEAFRATYLPPDLVDRRPNSIGRAIPNTEILVLREDGTPCAPDEPGELVQRGPLVALGYWNDPEATRERFRPLPPQALGERSVPVPPETVVFSGDLVRRDAEDFLYFIGRRDQMIKTSGYRVSPGEVEEALHDTGMVAECVAYGMPHEVLGQTVAVVAAPPPGEKLEVEMLLQECRQRLPGYMVPTRVHVRGAPLPRSPNGKIDRRRVVEEAEHPGGPDHQSPEG